MRSIFRIKVKGNVRRVSTRLKACGFTADNFIKKEEHLVVLYGDRSLLSAELNKIFLKERVFISENVNHVLFGTYFPKREEVKKKFVHIDPENYKE